MSFKDIVVFIEDEPAQAGHLNFAATLAEEHGSHLIATFVADRLELHTYASFAIGEGLTNMLRLFQERVRDAESRARREFETAGCARNLSLEWRVSESEVGEALMLHARHASLTVVGPRRETSRPSILSLSEDVIFSSGRPALMVPPSWPSDRVGRRIVIAWNGSREAARAVADALPFLVRADSVRLLVVPEDKVRHLLGADPGLDIARHLARHGVRIDVEQVYGADAGEILLERCRFWEADMLVMGAYGQSRISEFVFGGATRTILSNVERPLFLSR